MRYWLDTEFIEAGADRPVELLSLAIVAEDGRWWYGANSEADLSGANEWVRANVLPFIDFAQDGFVRHDIRANLLDLVGDDPVPEFWGWCCGFDYVLVSQLIGFNSWPRGWPYYFRDIQQDADAMGTTFDLLTMNQRHHALDDARQVKRLWEYLRETTI